MQTAEWAIPILIFFGRIYDVTIGTMRMITVITGHKYLSAALGFCEVSIWVIAVGSVVNSLDNPFAILAFAGGYSCGTLLGMTVEGKLALGYRVVQVINTDRSIHLAQKIRGWNYICTQLEGHGRDGNVEITLTAIKRKNLDDLMSKLSTTVPNAFISVERADRATGFTPMTIRKGYGFPWKRIGLIRK